MPGYLLDSISNTHVKSFLSEETSMKGDLQIQRTIRKSNEIAHVICLNILHP